MTQINARVGRSVTQCYTSHRRLCFVVATEDISDDTTSGLREGPSADHGKSAKHTHRHRVAVLRETSNRLMSLYVCVPFVEWVRTWGLELWVQTHLVASSLAPTP